MHWMIWVSRPAYINSTLSAPEIKPTVKGKHRKEKSNSCMSPQSVWNQIIFANCCAMFLYPYSLLMEAHCISQCEDTIFVLVYLRLAETIHSFDQRPTVVSIDSYSNAKSCPRYWTTVAWFHQRTKVKTGFAPRKSIFWSYQRARYLFADLFKEWTKASRDYLCQYTQRKPNESIELY